MKPMKERIAEVAPVLQEMVKQHNDGSFPEGVEAFNAKLMKILADADLIESKQIPLEKVAVIPSNREWAMLIPADVQSLIKTFSLHGFNPQIWDALACTAPSVHAEAWKKANMDLIEKQRAS